ncbi:MAG: hypothetical protein Q6J44_00625 [Gloeomargarita sp. DG02_4_bins_56]
MSVTSLKSQEILIMQNLTYDLLQKIEAAAEKIYQALKLAFGYDPEYYQVNATDFRGYVDLAYYRRLQSELVKQEYTWVGDIGEMNVAELMQRHDNTRTFIRAMINPTHNTSVAFYHLRPRGFLGFLAELKVFDCETEFRPEKYLVTTNAGKTPFDPPPGFDVVYLPPGTAYRTVLKTHYQRLQKAILTWNLSPTPLYNLDDVLAMQKRMHQAKNNYRKRIGYITEEELNRFRVDPEIAREVMYRLRRNFEFDSHY